jgi:hypothetical protein
MSRRTQPPMSNWKCEHVSPVSVEEIGGGKNRAKCLQCGERGEVREGTEEALQALRDLARQRDEAQSAK